MACDSHEKTAIYTRTAVPNSASKKAGKTLLLFSFFEKTFGTLRPIPAGRNQKV